MGVNAWALALFQKLCKSHRRSLGITNYYQPWVGSVYRTMMLYIAKKLLWLCALLACLASLEFARPGGDASAVLPFSSAHAQDGDDGDDGDDGGSAGGGSTGGGSGGGSGGSGDGQGLPFTFFSPSDREPNELLASGLTAAQLGVLRQQGFTIVRQRNSRLLANEVLRLKAPPSVSLNNAMDQVRRLAPRALVDFNHLYRPSTCDGASHQCPMATKQLLDWGEAPSCKVRTVVGLIDTTVDTAHPALRGQTVQLLRVRGADRDASSSTHGTAVASLLVGRLDSATPGLLPRSRLVAADAFHRRARGEDRMDAFDFAAALDALSAQGVGVVNLSFAGPANTIIESSIGKAQQRGMVLVAAVGNDGPMASPRYPAAYVDVIAVTAVRGDLNVFRRAVRGPHVAFAAPGVDIWAAQTPDARNTSPFGPQTGTSMAAPFVTAAAAVVRSNGAGKGGPAAVRAALIEQVKDLGAPGFDPVFGYGLLQMGRLCGAANPPLKVVTNP